MSNRSKCLIAATIFAVLVLAAPPIEAADELWTPHAQLGGSWVQGDASNALDTGYSIHGGATWHPFKAPLGFRFDLGVDAWNLSGRALNELNVGDGWARVISLTAEAMWEPEMHGAIGFYAGVGLGPYAGYFQLSNPSTVNGYWCNYWWGVCYPVSGTADVVVKDGNTTKIGYKGSIGLTFKTHGRASYYLEASYNYMEVQGGAEYIPVALGVRW